MKSKKLSVLAVFLILIAEILTSCSRVESLTEPEPDSIENISCQYVTISNGNESNLEVNVFILAGTDYECNAESCYLYAYNVIDSIAGTDSEINAITELNLNLNDSVLSINGSQMIIDLTAKIINFKKTE